jgi:hypothetical protein
MGADISLQPTTYNLQLMTAGVQSTTLEISNIYRAEENWTGFHERVYIMAESAD